MLPKRKIRNGRVKINGSWYYPNDYHMKYDGRLDGRQFYFGTYRGDDTLISIHSNDEEDNQIPFEDWAPWLFWYKNDKNTSISNS